MLPTLGVSNLQPPGLQLDMHPNEPLRPAPPQKVSQFPLNIQIIISEDKQEEKMFNVLTFVSHSRTSLSNWNNREKDEFKYWKEKSSYLH